MVRRPAWRRRPCLRPCCICGAHIPPRALHGEFEDGTGDLICYPCLRPSLAAATDAAEIAAARRLSARAAAYYHQGPPPPRKYPGRPAP